MGWEKGIITGRTSNQRTLFVSSSYDTLIFEPDFGEDFALGDFVEFTGTRKRSDRPDYQREVCDIRKCAPFAEIELLQNSCLVILNVIDVDEATKNRPYRVVRTDFFETVSDDPQDERIAHYNIDELMRKKVVCKRLPGVRRGEDFWGLISLRDKKVEGFGNYCGTSTNQRRDEQRTKLEGLVCTRGVQSQGKDDLYIWVPFRNMRDVYFPIEMRRDRDRWEFFGKWLSFTIGRDLRIDRDSNYTFIRDVLPTRVRDGRCEVEVSCFYDKSRGSKTPHLMLEGDACGTIADIHFVLERYKKTEKSFETRLWVHNVVYDYDMTVRWVLSMSQPRWNEEELENLSLRSEKTAPPLSGRMRDVEGYERRRRDDETEKRRTSDRAFGRQNEEDYYDGRRRENVTERRLERGGSGRDDDSDRFVRERRITPQKPRETQFEESERKLPGPSGRDFVESPSLKSSSPSIRREEPSRRVKTSGEGNEKSWKHSEYEKLRLSHEYMVSHGLKVPEGFLEKLNAAKMNASMTDPAAKSRTSYEGNSHLEDTESQSSSNFRTRKENARKEILEEQLEEYKHIVELFRDMLSDDGVTRAMKDFDPKTTAEIFKILF